MPSTDPENLIHQLAVGDATAVARIVESAGTSDDVTTLVAAALFSDDADTLLRRAAQFATSTRERHLVAIAEAHIAGDQERVGALARDHLLDHPDSVLVAWITASTNRNTPTRRDHP
jgi:hypothetical protein